MAIDDDREDWAGESPESIAVRLDAVTRVQQQIRFALGAMAVIATMILTATYNAYASYDYWWSLDHTLQKYSSGNAAPDILTVRALQNWVDSRNVTVSLLGIRVNIDDAPVLGTSSLLVFSLWLLLLVRRENYIVGTLLRDTDSNTHAQARELRWRVLHHLKSNTLFVHFQYGGGRIKSLHRSPPKTNASKFSKFAAAMMERLREDGFRLLSRFFYLFPPISCAVMFLMDRESYVWLPSPFRPDAAIPGSDDGFFGETWIVFLACWIPLAICSMWTWLFSFSTASVIAQYQQRVYKELDLTQHI